MDSFLRCAPVIALLAAAGADLRAQTIMPSPPQDTAAVVFVPPAAGAPASRIGAGTRRVGVQGTLATLLVPEGGGLTTLAQPVLVWHLSGAFSGIMRAEIREVTPGVRGAGRAAEARFRAGLHALDLTRSDLELETGRLYIWSVALIEPGTGRLVDRAEALVERVAPVAGVAAGDPRAAAAAGLWFDALDTVVEPLLSGGARLTDRAAFAPLAASAGLPPHVASADP